MRRLLDRIPVIPARVKIGKAKAEEDLGESSEPPASHGVGPFILRNDCEESDSGTDLVFVHGLRGSRLRTWSRNDICWPRDLLTEDVNNARVITWGYDSSVANVFQFASKESIFGHADTLLGDLARLRTGIVCRPGSPHRMDSSINYP